MLEKYNELMTVQEVSEVLKVSTRTVQKLLKNNVIGSIRVGKVYRVNKDKLIDYIGGKA